MTTREILDLVRFYGNKSQKGNAYTPEDFNLSLKDFNMQIYNDELSKFQVGAIIPSQLLRFKTSIVSGSLTTGSYTLPGDYQELITNSFTALIGGVSKYGEFVDDTIAKRMTHDAGYKLRENPIAKLKDGSFKVYPTDATAFSFEYLRVPVTPIYDYYIDANLNEVFMPVGTSHTLLINEVSSGGDDTVGAIIASLTVELDWDTIIHPRFVADLLLPMGVNLREADIVTASQLKKQEAR